MRVASWNLWWRFGDWSRRFDAILATLDDLRPDVVGLQEVWADGADNAAGRLAEALGLHWTWQPSTAPDRWRRRTGDLSVDVGNAVLSRWPILDTARLDLPGDGVDEGRVAAHALLDTPHGRLPFFTTHLASAPWLSALRREQVRAVVGFVASRLADDALPPVLTGDLNAVPESDEVRLLEGLATAPAVPELCLLDTWRHAPAGDAGPTWDPRNPHVAAIGSPAQRIDYVTVGITPGRPSPRVEGVGRFGDHPVAGVWPSDHLGVRADLRFAAPS